MNRLSAALLGLTALCLAGAARAEDPAYDKVFADRAFAAGLAEIAQAKMALDQSGNAKVRKFARRMIKDHSQANDELAQVAKAEGLGLPTLPTDAERAEAARLAKLTGGEV